MTTGERARHGEGKSNRTVKKPKKTGKNLDRARTDIIYYPTIAGKAKGL
jgi:hypothetical protein